jgi:hypothetical protein
VSDALRYRSSVREASRRIENGLVVAPDFN